MISYTPSDMRNDRTTSKSVKFIVIVVAFVALVALKSWALLQIQQREGAGGSRAGAALVETTVSGRLEIDLSDTGPRLQAVRAAFLSDDEAVKKSVESLIRRQVFTSYLQTIFRDPALPLPTDHMTLTIAEKKYDERRKRLVIPYSLTGYIVAPTDSFVESVPDLEEIGAETAETFIVPADPRHLFQRLGYACANQDEIPRGLVDDGNYGNYFDPTCAPGVADCTHPSGEPLEPCLDVLNRENGVAALAVRMKRVPYDEGLVSKWTSGPPTSEGGSDLTVDAEKLAEYDIVYRNFAPDSCAIAEDCVGGPGVRRLLRFRAVTPNVGDMDVAFGDVNRLIENTDQFVWSACHKHYHFNGYGQFALERGGKPVLPGAKQSFCVESTGRARNSADTPFTAPYQACVNQGIVAGWEDEYFAGLDCQWIAITDLAIEDEEERFQLSMEVNPLRLLCEGVPDPDKYVPALDEHGIPVVGPSGKPALKQACVVDPTFYENNKVVVDVTIPKTGSSVTAACPIIDFGGLRNCGWGMGTSRICTPGNPMWIMPLGEVTRVCPGTTPCPQDEALAGSAGAALTFTCPATGNYLVLFGPYLTR